MIINQMKIENKKQTKTDWGKVAKTYNKYLNTDKNYHTEVVIPNLLRLIGDVKGKNILDIACGQGQISSMLFDLGAKVSGFDAGKDLIKIAKENNKNIEYKILDAQNFAKDYLEKEKYKNFDIIICILAIQNIENVKSVLENIKKVSNKNTKIYFVINHPAFRIPKYSHWEYSKNEEGENIQFRRVDKYLSDIKIKMDMNPGEQRISKKEFTFSYHRSLQHYFKLFSNNNFVVTKLEEWISHKTSEENGKNSERENIARKEFPMFMCLEIKNF